MAGIRDPLVEVLSPPPNGMLKIAVWRHVAAMLDGPEIEKLHEDRAQLIHAFVETAEIDVMDWGGTDLARSAEVIEILVAMASAAVAPLAKALAEFLCAHVKGRRKEETGTLKAVTLVLPNGAELVLDYRHAVSGQQAQATVESFLAGEIGKFLDGTRVPRVLRPDDT